MTEKLYILNPPEQIFKNPKKPYLPDMEHPSKHLVTEKVNFPPQGGIEIFYRGHKYPSKGFPFPEATRATNLVKKTILGLVNFLNSPIKYLLPILILFPKRWMDRIILTAVENFVNFTKETLEIYYFKPERFCVSGREIYKVGLQLIDESKLFGTDEQKRTVEHLLMAILMIWESDNAYRYRFQAIAGQVNDWDLEKNPSGEIKRLFEWGAINDPALLKNKDDNFTSKKIRKFGALLYWLAKLPRFKRLIRDINNLIDWEKIKFDECDKYWWNYGR